MAGEAPASAGATVHVGLGANLGDRRAALEAAVEQLGRQTPGVCLLAVSRFIETEPLLAPGSTQAQPRYLNGACAVRCEMTPRELLQRLWAIERTLGRSVRRERWSARPIDLDILLWEQLVIDEPDFKVPHPELGRRRFALGPLAELAPAARHPLTGQTVAAMLEALP